jgi:hypothetical protein
MLKAKTNTNPIIIFDAPIFDELLHKSFVQHTIPLLTPATETDEAEHVEAHDPENTLTPPADAYVF